MEQPKQHFLVVTFPAQGHINPALHLAKRLAQTTRALVTFSTSISAQRRMFPSSAGDQELEDGLLTYSPFSDGYDDGFKPGTDDPKHYMSQFKVTGSQTVSRLAHTLAARDRPVTCIIYTLLLSWAADVARDLGIPSALYWIQPATVFAIYYHHFHGYNALISAHGDDPSFTVNLPGLPPLRIRELPSFLFVSTAEDNLYSSILTTLQETFNTLDRQETEPKPRVLVNTFDALESDALVAVDKLDLIAIGPLLPSSFVDGEDTKDSFSGGDLFEPDKKGYMEWLDSKPERSVVYVSFGTLAVLSKLQMEELSRGLRESGKPYLWVVVRRSENREGEGEGEVVVEEEEGEGGMVVEWCSQVRVLSHRSIGCFVTHCGWNSTVESLVCGVPTVGVPQWTDQGTNAWLVEKAWGTGVRGEVTGEGVVEGKELRRCLDVVMGEGERGVEIRRKVEMWKDRAREAVEEGGSSDRNLRAFVDEITIR